MCQHTSAPNHLDTSAPSFALSRIIGGVCLIRIVLGAKCPRLFLDVVPKCLEGAGAEVSRAGPKCLGAELSSMAEVSVKQPDETTRLSKRVTPVYTKDEQLSA